MTYHDPFVPIIPVTREHASVAGRTSVKLDSAVLATYNAVVIATDHDDINYRALVH